MIAKLEGVTEVAILSRLARYNVPVRTPREAMINRNRYYQPLRGEQLPYYGKKLSQETKDKQSAKRKGTKLSAEHSLNISKGTKRAWDRLTPKEKAERMLPSLRGMNKRPNTIETKLDNLLQENFPNEWKYVGNGEIVIGELIPDFININGRKEVLELFGNYWHDPKTTTDWRRTELGRIMHFNSYGFRCLVIWENDLMSSSSEAIEDIKRFIQPQDYRAELEGTWVEDGELQW